MSTPNPNLADSERLFRAARRRDWLWVWGCHGLALGLSGLVLVGLCAPHPSQIPIIFYPHLFYWTIGYALVFNRAVALCWLIGWALGPICFYRFVSYYRRGATRALLNVGLRGHWAGTEPRGRRFALALRYALLPTPLLLRGRLGLQDFELIEPQRRPPRLGLLPRALAVLALSLNHWPALSSLVATFCVVPSWTITLPSWAGPCRFGPVRGQQSAASPCRELTTIP